VGNKADVSGNDLLLAWEHDERTRVIEKRGGIPTSPASL
jgi:acyl-CoA synthetase (NDP forming)